MRASGNRAYERRACLDRRQALEHRLLAQQGQHGVDRGGLGLAGDGHAQGDGQLRHLHAAVGQHRFFMGQAAGVALAGAVVDEIGPPALFGGSAVLLPLLGGFFAGALKRRP